MFLINSEIKMWHDSSCIKTSKKPRCLRINATPKKGSIGTKEPIDNARASFSPSVPFPLLALCLSPLSVENYEGPARSGCVNDQSWPARTRALGRDADRAARAGGCYVRIYISDFLFMQLFVREFRERVSCTSRSVLPIPFVLSALWCRRPSSIVSVDKLARGSACAWGGTCSFSYTPAPIGLSVFLV